MKKFKPIGKKVKAIRVQLERNSTQKELAHEVGVGERTLRKIENENAEIPRFILDQLAKALGVPCYEIVYALDAPQLVLETTNPTESLLSHFDQDRLIPRYDDVIAEVTTDEAKLFSECRRSYEVDCIVETTLNSETDLYAQELFEVLMSLSYSNCKPSEDLEANEEIAIRRRIRQLLVLLKGNDIWVYLTDVFKTLPERNTLAPENEPHRFELHAVVVLGPPGEYGETTLRVSVDHGQPCILKAWNPEEMLP